MGARAPNAGSSPSRIRDVSPSRSAIESAAAGEHGKRFAVVAGEVRRLAERTRESAEEIKGIVAEIQSATNTSVLATEQGVKEVENGGVKETRVTLETGTASVVVERSRIVRIGATSAQGAPAA